MKSVRAVISGKVQGVWYRAWTREQAAARELSGWVRNCADGNVEAVFSGPDDRVDAMIAACRTGPPLANVLDIRAEPCPEPNPGFVTLPTRRP